MPGSIARWGLLVCLVTHAAPAAAQGSGAQAPAGLGSMDPEELGRALERAAGGGPADLQALARRVRDGLPPILLQRTVDALSRSRQPGAARLLMELARHRRRAVRLRVAQALVELRLPTARRVLTAMLDDAAPEVRAAAATGLGALGAGPSMNNLLAASRRGLPEATAVVAAQAGPPVVARFIRELTPDTLASRSELLLALARRTDLAAPTRVALVRAVAGLQTPAAGRLLQELVAGTPEGDPARVAAQQALDAAEEAAQEGEPEASGANGSTPEGGH